MVTILTTFNTGTHIQIHRERLIHNHTDTNRDTHTDTEIQRHIQTHIDTYTNTSTVRHRHT